MEKLNVLIVDDDKDTAEFFNMVLSMVGFNCEVVFTAKDALMHLAQTQPDIVLLDLRLGLELSGEDILYQIRSNPRFSHTRVVVITAYPAMTTSLTNLVDLVLIKPVDVDQLQTLTSRLTGKEVRPRLDFFRDPVTNLFNKELFNSRLSHAMSRVQRRPDYLFAVQVFSIDFRFSGDGSDSNMEDRSNLLWQTAERLRGSFRPTDTLACLDEYHMATLHEDLKNSEDLQILESRLTACLSGPFQVEDRKYHLNYKLGSALIDPEIMEGSDLFELALARMKKAKPSLP